MDENGGRDPRTYAIIGAAMEVHRQLGCGFLEAVYQEAMKVELNASDVPTEPQIELPIIYKGQILKCSYRADFVCYGSVIVELKALTRLSGTEESQIINYLKATGYEVGLLLNFGAGSLEHRRFVRSKRSVAPIPFS
ncbi:MAG: GxxExxY protein [Gemmataceae bacterium]